MMMSDEFAAMLPLKRKTAKDMAWDMKMPFPALMKHLEHRSKGRILDLENGVAEERPAAIGERDWARFLDRAKVTEDWIDLHVDI